ncbi:hypothetical protein ABZ370_34050 [Streptomyces sp. NPDC005962]
MHTAIEQAHLAAGQDTVCRALSGKQPDKFADIDWTGRLGGFGEPSPA